VWGSLHRARGAVVFTSDIRLDAFRSGK
jgi:hypothetical protein